MNKSEIRKDKLISMRRTYALQQLQQAGIRIKLKDIKDDKLKFVHKGKVVTLYPFTGWFFGRTIAKGRGINNLIKQVW